MPEQTTAPQDSVLRRHYESALLHGDDQTDQPGAAPQGGPEDSVLRRHHDSAHALQTEAAVASTATVDAAPSDTTDERATATEPSPPPANRAGPSSRPPAHARVPAKPAAPAGSGFISALRRLLGGP